jgi:23S rRNA (pseudouridine1915-N3)-methyltransferase
VNWKILAVGRPKLRFVAEGIEEYLGRIRHHTHVETSFIRASNRDKESAQLLQASTGTFRLLLDERGTQFDSEAFAELVRDLQNHRTRQLSLLVGGADGHAELLRSEADLLWSLSKATLQHELALLVALEQVYRAYTILSGAPYHRG